MVLDTTVIEAEIKASVDQKSFNDWVKFARDTGKKIDEGLRTELKLDVLRFEDQVKRIRDQLKRDIPEERRTQLRLDLQDARTGLTEARRQLRNLENTWDRATSRLQRKFDTLGQRVKKTFAWIGAAAVAFLAFDKILDFSKSLLRLGSDAEEGASKFSAVFWQAEEDVGAAFDGIADAVWRSRLELRQFGAGLGDILKPLWFAEEEAGILSKNLTQLALDVASFNNASDEQVINAFTSALTWEREALKSLGIVISEADVQQQAYSSWLAATGTELTKQQKALATYQLLLQNTTDAQWDAIRTAGGFANQLKALRGAITDAFAEAGQEIANQSAWVLETLTTFVREYGAALITTAVETVKTIGSVLGEAARWFAALFSLLSTETNEAQSEQTSFAKSIALTFFVIRSAFGVVAQIIRSVGILFADVFGSIILRAQITGQLIQQVFVDSFQAVIGLWWTLARNVWTAFNNAFALATDALNAFIGQINAIWIIELWEISWPTARDFESFNWITRQAFGETRQLAARFQALDAALPSLWQTFSDIGTGFSDVFGWIGNDLDDINQRFSDSGEEVWEAYDSGFDDISWLLDKFSWDAGKAARWGARAFKDASDEIKDVTEEATDDIADRYEVAFEVVRSAISKAEDEVKSLSDEIENSTQKIANINQEIEDVWATAAEKLAQRAVEITEELQDQDLSLFDREKLEEELDLINQNTTALERQEAARQANLSEAEKILEDRDQEISWLEEERSLEEERLQAAQDWLAQQQSLLERFRTLEQQLSERAAEQAQKEADAKVAAAESAFERINDLIATQSATALWTLWTGWLAPAWGWAPVTNVDQSEINIDIQVAEVADNETFLRAIQEELALRIQDTRRQNL